MTGREHERFEALAGALALGEANATEREAFDAHARGCETCRADAAAGASLVAALQASRDDERWSPAIEGELERTFAARRERRSQRTIVTVGYALAASVVLNLLVVGGIGRMTGQALRAPAESNTVALTPLRFERRARRLAAIDVRLPRLVRAPVVVAGLELAPPHTTVALAVPCALGDATFGATQACSTSTEDHRR